MRIGKQSFFLEKTYLHQSAVIVGPREYEGPLGQYYDFHYDSLDCGKKSWEQAEMEMYRKAFDLCLSKNNIDLKAIDCVVSGDLNNQIIIGNYVMRDYDVPYLGVFNACSSSVEGIIVGSNIIEADNASNIVVGISSHYATAERQYRYPTEYGGQKPETSTSTVSAGIASLISNKISKLKITKATVGRVIDAKLNDALDMGRAMAPAAYHTILQHFKDFDIDETAYDLILTGDLSYYGAELLKALFKEDGIDISSRYQDSGMMIYDREKQEVFAGGSGCGCLPSVAYTLIEKEMLAGKYKRVLMVGTGALLNPIILAQKETIPAIAHAIVLESE